MLKLSTSLRLFPRIGLPSLAKHTDNVSEAHKAPSSVEITASAARSLRKPLSTEGSTLDSDTSFLPLLQLPPNWTPSNSNLPLSILHTAVSIFLKCKSHDTSSCFHTLMALDHLRVTFQIIHDVQAASLQPHSIALALLRYSRLSSDPLTICPFLFRYSSYHPLLPSSPGETCQLKSICLGRQFNTQSSLPRLCSHLSLALSFTCHGGSLLFLYFLPAYPRNLTSETYRLLRASSLRTTQWPRHCPSKDHSYWQVAQVSRKEETLIQPSPHYKHLISNHQGKIKYR